MATRSQHYQPYIADLCAGVGMLGVGVECATGGSVVLHVERDSYAAAVLVARMEDAALHPAPIWDDIVTLDGQRWRGHVDIVCAGFPCQPVSCAGARRGTEDERWIWPHIARAIRDIRPGLVFLENPPGLLALGFAEILADLAALGYDAEWTVLGAGQVGAAQRRDRVFILGYATDRQWGVRRSPDHGAAGPSGGSGGGMDGRSLFAPGPNKYPYPFCGAPQPVIRRMAPGMARRLDPGHRTDRIRRCGEGVVPLQAAVVFRLLADRARNGDYSGR